MTDARSHDGKSFMSIFHVPFITGSLFPLSAFFFVGLTNLNNPWQPKQEEAECATLLLPQHTSLYYTTGFLHNRKFDFSFSYLEGKYYTWQAAVTASMAQVWKHQSMEESSRVNW